MSHQYIKQMHGFFMDKDEKSIRFDMVVSFDVPDRAELHSAVVDDILKSYPDYSLQIAMDTDFTGQA